MKNLNSYTNKSEYTSDSNRSTTESTVSYIKDGNGVIYTGKNVIVGKSDSGVGDVCVFDTAVSSVMFIKYSTYYAATLPSTITILGVVYYRTENKVFIVSKNKQSSAKWAEGYKVKLAGFDFVTGGAFTITINIINTTKTTSVSYTTSDTLTTTATKIDIALNNIGIKNWTVTADNTNNCVTVVGDYFTAVISSFSVTDAALKVNVTIITQKDYQCAVTGLLTPYSNIARKDGSSTWYGGANYPKFYNYNYTNGSTQTNEPLKSNNIVKYTVFNSTYNPILTSYYGTGETGYIAYIKDKMLKYPYSNGAIIGDNGQNNTNLLAHDTYTDVDGTVKSVYPAAYNAKNYGISVAGYTTGFEIGNWWLPSAKEMYLLIKNVQLDNSDVVNKTLTAIGGDNVIIYLMWTSTEFSAYNAWAYLSNNGNINYGNKYNTGGVRSVIAF